MTVKKAAPRPSTAALAIKPALGIPAGRLLELQLETNLPKPYVVTDTITIVPPTKERADKMRESQLTIMVYSQLLSEATQRSVSEEEINGLSKYIKEAERNYNEALFGDQYDNVTTFFANQDAQLWKAFENDIQKKFFPSQPVDGKCQTCGHVIDADAEGKAPGPSPSSSTGGTN
ncbi:MAG: hypothetical protein WBZ37_27690 [Mycobacterium sp.]